MSFLFSMLSAIGLGSLLHRRNQHLKDVDGLAALYRVLGRLLKRGGLARIPDPERGTHLARVHPIRNFEAVAAVTPPGVTRAVLDHQPPAPSPANGLNGARTSHENESRVGDQRGPRGTGTPESSISRFLYRGVLLALVYVSALDGIVRLETNSSSVTLLRDAIPWSLAVIAVLVALVRPRPRSLKQPLIGLVCLFVAITLVELLNPDTISIRTGLAALRPHLEFVPLFFLGYAVFRREDRLRGLALVMVAVGAANGVVSIIQSGLSPAQLGTWGPGYHELVTGGIVDGQIHNPAIYFSNGIAKLRPPALGAAVGFGGVIGDLALPFALALIMGNQRRRDRIFALVCLPLIAAALITSQTRSDVVAAVVEVVTFCVIFAVRYRRGATPLLVVAALGVGVVMLGGVSLGRYSSIAPAKLLSTFGAQRGGSFALIPQYAVKYPFGAGLGTAGPGVAAHASVNEGKLSGENSFVYLIVELGLPGLLVVIAMLITTLRRATSLARSRLPRETLSYLAALTAALYGCTLLTLSGPVTATPPSAPFIWLAFGVVAAWWAVRVRRRRAGSPAPP